jgi:hypothetical protein
MENTILREITNIRGKKMKRHGSVVGYEYVRIVSFDGEMTYRAEIPLLKICKSFENSRDAALYVDKELLKAGKQPVNILKKK